MQRLPSLIRTWDKPSVSVQCSTSVGAHPCPSNCAVAPRFLARGASPSQQLVSKSHLCLKGADVSLPECLVASSSCNSSSASTKRECLWNVVGPTISTLKSEDIEEEEELTAMVRDYIEDGINDANCPEEIDGMVASALTDFRHYETLQHLLLNNTPPEVELFSVISAIILSMKDKDLAYFTCSPNCRGSCICHLVVKHLQLLKYDAAVCSCKWSTSGKMPGGEYEYIDVNFGKDPRQNDRFVVDIDFRSQFEIARPTQSYLAALGTLPVLFVGSAEKLSQVLPSLAEAAKLSLRENAMPVPPWRTLSYMTSKWLSPFERHTQKSFDNDSRGLNGRGIHIRSTEQCIQQLHHLKMCLSSSIVNKMHTLSPCLSKGCQ